TMSFDSSTNIAETNSVAAGVTPRNDKFGFIKWSVYMTQTIREAVSEQNGSSGPGRYRRWSVAPGLLAAGILASPAPLRTNGHADIEGARLYYESAGAGSPVVLVSGGGTLDRRQWDDEYKVLAKRYHVIRYDVRGIGRSTRPTGDFSH